VQIVGRRRGKGSGKLAAGRAMAAAVSQGHGIAAAIGHVQQQGAMAATRG